MKAIVYDKRALPDGLRYTEIEKQTPNADEILVRIHAASVNPVDYHVLRHPSMRRVVEFISKQKNSQPGRDMAGKIEAVGSDVTQFKVGDSVFGAAPGTFA